MMKECSFHNPIENKKETGLQDTKNGFLLGYYNPMLTNGKDTGIVSLKV